MAGILEQWGMGMRRRRPHNKRERKQRGMNGKDDWSRSTSEKTYAYAASSTPMKELVPQEEETMDQQTTTIEDEEFSTTTIEDEDEDLAALEAAAQETAEPGIEEIVEPETESQADEAADVPETDEQMSDEDEEEAPAQEGKFMNFVDDIFGKIDAFREQAKQLKTLMQQREDQAKEMEALAAEREGKAQEMEALLEERENQLEELDASIQKHKEEAEGITEEVAKRLDVIYDRFAEKLDASEAALRSDITETAQAQEAQHTALSDTISGNVAEQLGAVQAKTDAISESVQAKADAISESVSEVAAKADAISEGVDNVQTAVHQVSADLGTATESLNGLSDKFADVTDTVHSECVKSYRNTADLIKELDDKLDEISTLKAGLQATRKFAALAATFAIVDLVGIIVVIAMTLFM